MARVVVCGYMIRHPAAGNLMAFFQYVLGFHRLGHDVVYLEESGWPYSCYNPETRLWEDHPAAGLRIVRDLFALHGLPVPILYINRETGRIDGASREEVDNLLNEADLLVNVGGVCDLPEFRRCRLRVLIDMDPLFSQVDRFGAGTLDDYHVHFSYGANIGREGCSIPTRGVAWEPTIPPVVLDLWKWAEPLTDAPFTTIANWGSYGGLEHEGERYGQKDEEFLRFIDLPGRSGRGLEIALSGGHDARARLRNAGWSIRDAGDELGEHVEKYVDYIRSSHGEFSVAKHAYVKSRSGWFSDRSVCYLAAGLPVVVQETGFGDWLPTGSGVLNFRDLDGAARCFDAIELDYPMQRRAAREIAETVFAHDRVLTKLLDRAFAARAR